MRTLAVYGYIVVLLGGLAAGCDILTVDKQNPLEDEFRRRIEDRREQWQSQRISDYRLVFSQRVGTTIVDSVTVFVRGRAVDSTRPPGEALEDTLLIGTINSFFDLLEKRVGDPESQLNVRFNTNMGYPKDYSATFTSGRPTERVRVLSLDELGTEGDSN